jgi:CRP-like cAMP-binding protein
VPRRGTPIYAAGDPGQAVFTVRVGVVKLVMEIPGRESRIVRLLGRGATLGLEALAGRPYAHTAVTLRTTSLCEIPLPTVDELHVHNPRILHGLMEKWNEQVVWADRWIAILGSGTVPQRFADLARLIADISGDPLEAVHLPPAADIAAILGCSSESVSRHLAELKRAGLLTYVAPRTYRCDPQLFDKGTPVAGTP